MDNIKAIENCIEKWRGNCEKDNIQTGIKTCALCDLYWENTLCTGCPIAKVTGVPYCDKTPYSIAANNLITYRQREYRYFYSHPTIDPCVREVMFLENLLMLLEYNRSLALLHLRQININV